MAEESRKNIKQQKPKSLKAKLLDLKKKVAIMQKNGKGYGYDFVTEESILLLINDDMIKNGLKLTPSFVPGTLQTEIINYVDSKGKSKTDILAKSEMKFTWEDINTGEIEVIDWLMIGQQGDGSQALGSGLTYANRYFLLKYFNVATSKYDPDKIRNEMEAKAAAEEKKKISAIQTKVKKIFASLIQKYQKQDKVYEILGTTKEQFLKDFNNQERVNDLLEQMELLLKEDNNA